MVTCIDASTLNLDRRVKAAELAHSITSYAHENLQLFRNLQVFEESFLYMESDAPSDLQGYKCFAKKWFRPTEVV